MVLGLLSNVVLGPAVEEVGFCDVLLSGTSLAEAAELTFPTVMAISAALACRPRS